MDRLLGLLERRSTALQVPCDLVQDRAIYTDTRMTFIYAYGNGGFGYHGSINRGQYDLTLLPAASSLPSGAAAALSSTPALKVSTSRLLRLLLDCTYYVWATLQGACTERSDVQ
jgi:hypothetical protein